MTVCVIPARGGSKRIPRKNIKEFHKKPLIGYSIEKAQLSGLFDRIIVSTDDKEIAEVAESFGAEVPFVRPAELSDDHANTFDLLQHAATWVSSNQRNCEFLCCLYATAPFVLVEDLLRAHKTLLENNHLDYVYSMTEFPFPIQRSIRKVDDRVEPCFPENMFKRSQDLEKTYHDTGQFYWGRLEAFLKKKEFFSNRSTAIELPRYRVVDIDTPEDWIMAELQFEILKKSGRL